MHQRSRSDNYGSTRHSMEALLVYYEFVTVSKLLLEPYCFPSTAEDDAADPDGEKEPYEQALEGEQARMSRLMWTNVCYLSLGMAQLASRTR